MAMIGGSDDYGLPDCIDFDSMAISPAMKEELRDEEDDCFTGMAISPAMKEDLKNAEKI